MDYKVLLLTFLLVVVVEGQTTTPTPPSTPTSKADQESAKAADQEPPKAADLESTKAADQESTKAADQESTKGADDSTESASTEDGDMKVEGSSNRFSFTEADALMPQKQTLPPKPDNDLGTSDDDEDPMVELTLFQKLLSDSEKLSGNDESTDSSVNNSKTDAGDDDNDNDNDDNDEDDDDDEGDDDSDEDGEDNPKPSSDTNDSVLVQKPEQLRRQGDLRPGFGMDSSNAEDSNQNQNSDKKSDSPAPVYLPGRQQIITPDLSREGSPVLQLTQGGYRNPYDEFARFEDQRQRMRSPSASQQSETLEAPRVSSISGDQARPQIEYSTPYQPQLNLGARPAFQHPSGGFVANGILPGGLQNGYFNTPPAGFTDFSSANFQSQFHPSDNGGFSGVPRDQGFSLFQTQPRQNPGLFFHGAPQYPQAQPIIDNHPRSQPLFHPGGFSNFPNLDIVDDTPRPNYSPYMRHPAMNQHFQVNPNFYGTLPNSGVNDFNNPGINLLPNYPGNAERQPFQPQLFRYPLPNNQITLQSSDQVEKQKPDYVDPSEETKPKESEALKTSQDKEDPSSVPFGVRIRQNNAPDQNAVSGQRDVYLRYPVREAGYATEENLPVQNTTEKTRNTDASLNPPIPFFTSPEEFRPFSSPDPYGAALRAVQQSYANNNRNIDDSNQTKESPADQLARNAPGQFDERLARPPNQIFPSYQGNQETPVFQNRPFFPVPGLDRNRNPFFQLPNLPESRYPFSAPGSVRNVEGLVKTPACAQDKNASVCFEDTNYPMRELVYALNSNAYLMERLSSPNQIVEEVTLEDQKASGDQDSDDNYICKSDVKFGLPLRAKNVKGTWKVVVNVDKESENMQFLQTVRLETCSALNQPCSFTQVKTACVQKYNLQRLLSWDQEKGIHTDVYKLPVACSCQIVDAQA